MVEGSALGPQAGTSRRIENYLGFPAGISGSELTVRAVGQARKFGTRMATPYRAVALETGAERYVVRLESGRYSRDLGPGVSIPDTPSLEATRSAPAWQIRGRGLLGAGGNAGCAASSALAQPLAPSAIPSSPSSADGETKIPGCRGA